MELVRRTRTTGDDNDIHTSAVATVPMSRCTPGSPIRVYKTKDSRSIQARQKHNRGNGIFVDYSAPEHRWSVSCVVHWARGCSFGERILGRVSCVLDSEAGATVSPRLKRRISAQCDAVILADCCCVRHRLSTSRADHTDRVLSAAVSRRLTANVSALFIYCELQLELF